MDCYSTSLDRRAEIKSKSESDCFCFPLKHKHGQSKNVVANIHSSVGVDTFQFNLLAELHRQLMDVAAACVWNNLCTWVNARGLQISVNGLVSSGLLQKK